MNRPPARIKTAAAPCVAALAAALTVSVPAWSGSDDSGYRLGRGYRLGNSGFRLGGYASLGVEVPRGDSWALQANDLSLFLSWDQGGRLRFFSELEVGDAFGAGEKHGLNTADAHFEFERGYFDAILTDRVTLRIGKFLTPIGRWNLIHADPLVWTATRPLATEDLFATNANGVMLHGNLPLGTPSLEYAVYADFTNTIDPYRSGAPFDHAYGGHLLYSFNEQLQFGLSYAAFEHERDRNGEHHLVGLEGLWSRRQYEVSGEWVFRSGQAGDAWQGFLQGVAPLGAHWYAVGRYELFGAERRPLGQAGVFGLALRPIPPLVWKVEYRLGTHNEQKLPDGLFGSFAVLF